MNCATCYLLASLAYPVAQTCRMQNLGLPQLTKNKLSNPIYNKHISFSVSLSGRRILLPAAITEEGFRLLTVIHSAPVVVNCNKM